MGLSGCYGVIKYLMVLLNLIYWLVGFAIVFVAVWMLVDSTFLLSMTQDENHYYIGLFIFLTAGALLLIGGLLGSCGVLRESQCMLIAFFSCLLIILVAEIAAGIWAYTNAPTLEVKIRKAFRLTVQEEYSVYESRTMTFDRIQKDLQCCGADGPNDWNNSQYNKKNKSTLAFTVTSIAQIYNIPESCCVDGITKEECSVATKGGIIGSAISKSVYSQGCIDKFMDTIKEHMAIVFAVVIGVITAEVLGIIFSLVLCFAINRSDRYKA